MVYVAGWGRSGSTLLETLLTGDTTVCVGETFQLWSSSPLARYCSCGDELADCPVWGKVVSAFDRPWDRVVDEMRDIRRRVLRTRYVRALARDGRWAGSADVERYGQLMHTLYRCVAHETGAQTIIDSSKLPLDLAALARSEVNLRVVHLVRDPRAVAASWKRTIEWQMPHGQIVRMPTHPAWSSAARWDLYHGLTSVVIRGIDRPALRVSYESLVRLDQPTIDALAAFTDQPGLVDRARRAATSGLDVPVQHAIAGNPGRRSGAPLLVREDDAWRTELSSPERAAVGALGLPYLALHRTHLVRG